HSPPLLGSHLAPRAYNRQPVPSEPSDDRRWCPYRAPVARYSIPRAPRRHLSAHRASAGSLRIHGPSRALRLAAAGLPGRPYLRLQGARPLQGLGSSARCTRLLPLFPARPPPSAGFPPASGLLVQTPVPAERLLDPAFRHPPMPRSG